MDAPCQSTFGNRVGQLQRILCSRCHQITNHRIVACVDRSIDWDDYVLEQQFEILECCGCEEISFRRDWQSSDEVEYDEQSGQEGEAWHHEEVFPYRLAGRSELRDIWLLPNSVRVIYQETLGALIGGQRVLAGVGVRALVETVCRQEGAQGLNLKSQIDWLVLANVLGTAGGEILHNLRVMGNAAAHEVKPHSDTELAGAMDVVEHLLQGVYILPARARAQREPPAF